MIVIPHVESAPIGQPPKLLDQLRDLARAKGHSATTAQAYVKWCCRFILFHQKRHPKEMSRAEIGSFLEHVARTQVDPLPALEASRQALAFLFVAVLHMNMGELPLPQPPRLLDQVKQVLRVKQYSRRTEDSYAHWIKRYILFHGNRHPRELGAAEVEKFLTDLAVNGRVAASTQNLALNAVVLLYSQVLEIDLGRFEAVRARRTRRLPVVLSAEEVWRVLEYVEGADGAFPLMARLLYGCGLRQMECCRLGVKEVNLERHQIIVRCGKGNKDRVVMLPGAVKGDQERQLDWRRQLHQRDLARGVARVELP